MFNFEPVISDHNVRGLRRLFDTITSHIRSLKSLEFHPAAYATTFCPKLLTKLPNDLRLIVSRTLPSDKWDLKVMLDTIEQELNARERSGVIVVRQPQQQDDKPTGAALFTSIQPICCCCNNPHKPFNCEAVVQVRARKQILKKSVRLDCVQDSSSQHIRTGNKLA